jgi:hypothetical protein
VCASFPFYGCCVLQVCKLHGLSCMATCVQLTATFTKAAAAIWLCRTAPLPEKHLAGSRLMVRVSLCCGFHACITCF